jgi:hypothetical protein
MGREFGNVASSVAISMGNMTCDDPSLSFRTRGATGAIAVLQCKTKMTTVGETSLFVEVASQRAVWDDLSYGSFEFSCKQDHYGDEGEHCVECPVDPITGVYVTDCPGGRENPVALDGWFYAPLDVASEEGQLLCHPKRLPPWSAREACPHVSLCGDFNNQCKGGGGGDGQKDFPFLNANYENILNPSKNSTCKIAPTTSVCQRCANTLERGSQIEDLQCNDCRWACRDTTGFHYNIVQYGNQCTRGTMGDLCNDCVEGYYKMNNVCELCPDNTWLLVLLALFACLFGGTAFWLFEKYNVNVAICTFSLPSYCGFFAVVANTSYPPVPLPS